MSAPEFMIFKHEGMEYRARVIGQSPIVGGFIFPVEWAETAQQNIIYTSLYTLKGRIIRRVSGIAIPGTENYLIEALIKNWFNFKKYGKKKRKVLSVRGEFRLVRV